MHNEWRIVGLGLRRCSENENGIYYLEPVRGRWVPDAVVLCPSFLATTIPSLGDTRIEPGYHLDEFRTTLAFALTRFVPLDV